MFWVNLFILRRVIMYREAFALPCSIIRGGPAREYIFWKARCRRILQSGTKLLKLFLAAGCSTN
jgi:hypothetical protein